MSPRVEALVAQASIQELVSLLAGDDFWHTVAVPRLGIPPMRVTDGPTGARGTRFDGGRSINVPCGSALAATWDPAEVDAIAHVLGRETKAKGASVLLAPTVNLHRTPVGGRNFECMSEDPYLTARIAVAYVQGLQAEGVASCIKHFVANDTEFERMSIDSQVDERTLRELYLVPFEAAVREANVLSVMTSYNQVNGTFAASSELIERVLRNEWGFDGLVMSDWFGLHDTVEAANAGLDLEMPGPTKHRGQALVDAVTAGHVTEDVIRARARAVLTLMERTGALDVTGPGPEDSREDAVDDVALVRKVGAQSMVLLRNQPASDGVAVLPIDTTTLRRVAVIGPNAAVGQIMGGGSAHVTPTSVSNPLDAITARLTSHGIEVVAAQGCFTHKRLPALDTRLCANGAMEFFDTVEALDDAGAVPNDRRPLGATSLMWPSDPLDRPGNQSAFGLRLHADLTPDVSGRWQFSVESLGTAKVSIDDAVVIDNAAVGLGGSFFGMGRDEQIATVDLVAGQTYRYQAELRYTPDSGMFGGINLGSFPPQDGDPMHDAVDAASDADLSIVIVGTNDDWETEGADRTSIALPERQDELIGRVAAACPRTVVVVNAGSPVAMPWLDEVEAVVMAWFPGQEMGNALVDVLTGDVEPQGRLPVSFPRDLADTPAFEFHPGTNGMAQYRERRLIGYRWYDTVGKVPLFPFGFGLGYNRVDIVEASAPDPLTVAVTLANDADGDGVCVVQVYAHQLDRAGLAADEPDQKLVGFGKFAVAAGQRRDALVHLDPHSYRRWTDDGWRHAAGEFELRVSVSSQHVVQRVRVTV